MSELLLLLPTPFLKSIDQPIAIPFRMKTLSPSHPISFHGLSPDLRLLVQHVSDSASVNHEVRRRAQVLLLLDDGHSFAYIAAQAGYPQQRVHELVQRHAREGLRATLLESGASAVAYDEVSLAA